jgi:hypothetical protein
MVCDSNQSIVSYWLLICLEGMMSVAASLGLSLLWDTEVGLSHIDKYTYFAEEHIKVSGFFKCGVT